MKRPVQWTFAILAGLGGILGAFVGLAYSRARLILSEQLRQSTAIVETIQPEATIRPAIFEPEKPGNAWDLEDRVLGELDPYAPRNPDMHTENRLRLGGEIFGGLDEDSQASELEKQIDTLRDALRRSEIRPPRRPGVFTADATSQVASRLIASAMSLHRDKKDFEAAERLVLAIGLAQDVSRHGDYRHWSDLVYVERHGTWAAWQILSAHSLTAGELTAWAKWMDRLKSARPSLASIISIDSALSKKDIIEDFANVAMYTASPAPSLPVTWRDLWSRTMAQSRSVLAFDRTAKSMTELARRPGWERGTSPVLESDVGFAFDPDNRIVDQDAASELYLLIWRVSIALAAHEVERGAFPTSLGQLVPQYLQEDPRSPRTGKALDYAEGTLSSNPGPGFVQKVTEVNGPNPDLFRWKIGRKLP